MKYAEQLMCLASPPSFFVISTRISIPSLCPLRTSRTFSPSSVFRSTLRRAPFSPFLLAIAFLVGTRVGRARGITPPLLLLLLLLFFLRLLGTLPLHLAH